MLFKDLTYLLKVDCKSICQQNIFLVMILIRKYILVDPYLFTVFTLTIKEHTYIFLNSRNLQMFIYLNQKLRGFNAVDHYLNAYIYRTDISFPCYYS